MLTCLAITAAVDFALDSAGVDLGVKDMAVGQLRTYTTMFTGLETSYQRQKFYKKNFGLVVSVFIHSVVYICNYHIYIELTPIILPQGHV